MSRWGIDPPDDDAYNVRYDGTDCADCGRPAVAWLCETCSDQRASWAAAAELRMAEPGIKNIPAVVDVALVPISHLAGPVVECGLIPRVAAHVFDTDARDLKRMAKAILSADLSHVKDVA